MRTHSIDVGAGQYRSFLENGMLSSEPPLEHLPPSYVQWEKLLKQAQTTVRFSEAKTKEQRAHQDVRMSEWRGRVQRMAVLPLNVDELSNAVVQRAHHVLAFLVQFYVQSLSEEARINDDVVQIPAPIAMPLVAASRYLGIAPIVTYADTVLWNWKLIDPRQPISVTNVRIVDLFTGNPQEEHFFLTSLKMEICGRISIREMLDITIPSQEDADNALSKVSYSLRKIAGNLDELTRIFCDVRHGVKPDFFYNEFRPWIQGSDQGAESPSWLYEGTDLILQPSGPSAGQSAMMQSFDVFLGVKHLHTSLPPGSGCAYVASALNPHRKHLHRQNLAVSCLHLKRGDRVQLDNIDQPCFSHARQCKTGIDRSLKSLDNKVDTSFNARMRTYMPRQHQEYLLWLENRSPFQLSKMRHPHCPEVLRAHQQALQALGRWRNAHIQVVTQYVVLPARRKFNRESTEERKSDFRNSHDVDRVRASTSKQVVRGTGGTSLIPLLKIYRENTKQVHNGLVSKVIAGREEKNVIFTCLWPDQFGKMVVAVVWAVRRVLKSFSEAWLLLLIVLLCNLFV